MNNNTTPGSGTPLFTLALMASALGLAATATEAEVTSKIKNISQLDQLVKDGKIIVLDSVSDLDARLKTIEDATLADRLKKLEDAATKSIAVLSATIDGKIVTFTAEDVVKLTNRVKKLEDDTAAAATAAANIERNQLIARFAADGKVPKGPDGRELSNDDLVKLDLASLRLLHANTPATVPLSARAARADDVRTAGVKGLDRTRAAFQRQYDAALARS